MELIIFLAVLSAAAMHAAWNAVVKVGLDRFLSILLLSFVQSGCALLLIPLFPVPTPDAWPWVVVSSLLHSGYKIFLIRAYEHGDFSQVYPLARGTAPLIVAIVGAAVLGEAMPLTKMVAVLAIGSGVIVMSMKGGGDLGAIPAEALAYALGAAAFTASYTIVDGIGARLSGTPSGFTMWLFVGDGAVMAVYAGLSRGRVAFAGLAPAWRSGLIAGALSLASYWIAIWAFTRAPIALVAALRETSVLFAMLIAVIVLKEDAGRWRWLASTMILIGILLVRI